MRQLLTSLVLVALSPLATFADDPTPPEKLSVKFDASALEKAAGIKLKSTKQGMSSTSYVLLFTIEKELSPAMQSKLQDAFSTKSSQPLVYVVVKDEENVVVGGGAFSKATRISALKGDAFRVVLDLQAEGRPNVVMLNWNSSVADRVQEAK